MIDRIMQGNERAETIHVAAIKARLEPQVRELARRLQERLPRATVTTHLLATASFPWWAVVSVCKSAGARDEIAVIDVAYWRNANRSQLSCDLSTGSGAVLSELRERVYERGQLDGAALEDWMAETGAYLMRVTDIAVGYAMEHGL